MQACWLLLAGWLMFACWLECYRAGWSAVVLGGVLSYSRAVLSCSRAVLSCSRTVLLRAACKYEFFISNIN